MDGLVLANPSSLLSPSVGTRSCPHPKTPETERTHRWTRPMPQLVLSVSSATSVFSMPEKEVDADTRQRQVFLSSSLCLCGSVVNLSLGGASLTAES